MKYRVGIIGSGYGGTILGSVLRRMGCEVWIIERERHPKFSIGESSTPLSNFLLEYIGNRYDLPHLFNLSCYGRWQQAYPHLPVGLKRGFTFYFHKPDRYPSESESMRMAASPDDWVADTHWFRSTFDQFLLDKCIEIGVNYLDSTNIVNCIKTQTGCEIKFCTNKENFQNDDSLSVDLIVDSTGSPAFSQNHFSNSVIESPFEQDRFSIYGHFKGVERTHCFHTCQIEYPYISDDAAVHHMIPAGWMWSLRFNNGVTSAGFSLDKKYYSNLDKLPPKTAWNQLISKFPGLKMIFGEAECISGFKKSKSTSFKTKEVIGAKHWFQTPSSIGFTDPLLSTGFSLNLLGILRLLFVFESNKLSDEKLESIAESNKLDLANSARFIFELLKYSDEPDKFRSKSLIFFTAIIQQELRSRLGLISPTTGFAMREFKEWHLLSEELLKAPLSHQQLIEKLTPWDLGGILKYKNFQIPASKDDLENNCFKLGIHPEKIQHMLLESREDARL